MATRSAARREPRIETMTPARIEQLAAACATVHAQGATVSAVPAWGGDGSAPDRPAQCLPVAYILPDRLLGSCPVALLPRLSYTVRESRPGSPERAASARQSVPLDEAGAPHVAIRVLTSPEPRSNFPTATLSRPTSCCNALWRQGPTADSLLLSVAGLFIGFERKGTPCRVSPGLASSSHSPWNSKRGRFCAGWPLGLKLRARS